MCIRDRTHAVELDAARARAAPRHLLRGGGRQHVGLRATRCLLYTSDAADERSSVDLGGRRIIKKKTQVNTTANYNKSLDGNLLRSRSAREELHDNTAEMCSDLAT